MRRALQAGDWHTFEALLGRQYYISGRVVHGDKRGRELGFRTANINLLDSLLSGIFVVKVWHQGRFYQGVASVGFCPHFPRSQSVLEVHILDFDANIYGYHLTVYFLHRLRSEARFDSRESLVQQITTDVCAARAYFEKFN